MFPVRLSQSSLTEVLDNATTFVAACGYETRSSCLVKSLSRIQHKYAICFEEHAQAFSRKDNEQLFRQYGFSMLSGNSHSPVQIRKAIAMALEDNSVPSQRIAFDISSMTRAWHGAIIRTLVQSSQPLETYFIYVPAKYHAPSTTPFYNEIVAPVEGFASLAMPDSPMGLVLGLGYDRDRALGLQELLDPKRTVLMVPKSSGIDEYYPQVLESNLELLRQTPPDWVFEYSLFEPISTFAMLESICDGLQRSFRVVLASLGPKLFGMLCLILAAKYPELSVWQATSGVHASPRNALAELQKAVVVKVQWE